MKGQVNTEIPRVGFVSLGCPKALVDAEQIVTQVRHEGYVVVSDYAEADVVVVNTCGFIESAIEESLDAIGEALQANGRVIVTGCLGAKGDQIRAHYPEVLAITGPHDREGVMQALHRHLPTPGVAPLVLPPQGIKLTPSHYAYLKISEGCNHRCTFCIIPSLRGDLVSRSSGEVLREAEQLVAAGVRELLVISQDTSAYGVDLRYRTDFWQGRPVRTRITELARALGSLGVWVRLHYVYPYPHVDELIPLMGEGRLLPYLDIPLQHASPRILRAMKRPGEVEKTLERIQRWRQECPDLTLRSTFIVGFPGETEDDFAQLLSFLGQAELDRVGCFAYSPVEGARANDLPDAVPEAIREERVERLMRYQEPISARRQQRWVGRVREVLVDTCLPDGTALGRSASDAPEIDGVVEIAAAHGLRRGEIVKVQITGASTHDLQGTVVQS